jgi:aspartyl-tRNA(Asn)/glutamyl-tRNA(Gln) amidotransferase subunit B
VQETRGWDENKKETFIQRSKEEAHDYRYFPEPDLVPFDLSNIKIEKEKVPFEIRKEIMKNYGLNLKEVDILIWQRWALVFFEDVFKILEKNKENVKIVFNYLTTDIFGLVEKYKENKIKPEDFAKLVNLLKENKISSRIFKDALFKIFEGEILDNILKEKKIDDVDTIRSIIKEVLKENENAVLDFKNGKENAFEFLIGQCMRKTSGKIDPEIARKILKETLTNL